MDQKEIDAIQADETEDTALDKREKRRKFICTFLITLAIGAVLCLVFMWAQGAFSAYQAGDSMIPQTNLERLRIASDACFIFGVLVAGIGALRYVKNKGAFSGITYSVKTLTWPLRLRHKDTKAPSYYEYRQEQIEKEKELRGGAPIILAGCVFIVLALVTSLMFMSI